MFSATTIPTLAISSARTSWPIRSSNECAGPSRGKSAGERFKFMHGHEVDPVNAGGEPGKGRIFCILAGLAEDRNRSPTFRNGDFVEDDLETVGEGLLGPCTAFVSWISRLLRCGGLGMGAEHLTPAQNPNRAKEMLAMYQEDMEDSGYDVLVAGHTHQPGRIGDWYFNSGTSAKDEQLCSDQPGRRTGRVRLGGRPPDPQRHGSRNVTVDG